MREVHTLLHNNMGLDHKSIGFNAYSASLKNLTLFFKKWGLTNDHHLLQIKGK